MTIERDDFNRLEDRLTEAMNLGFGGINARLDTLNGRTRMNEMTIAVNAKSVEMLETRSTALESQGAEARKLAAYWGGFVGGVLMVAGWIAERLWK